MRSAWKWIYSVLICWYLRLGLYAWWSHLYQQIFEEDYLDALIRPVASIEALAQSVRGGELWRADGWRQLIDAVSAPAKMQAAVDGDIKCRSGLDCDDHAIYLVAAIMASRTLRAAAGIVDARMLTVTWLQGWREAGHNVCLIRYANGTLAYMDYGMPSEPRASVAEVVDLVLERYAPGAALLVYAVQRPDLSPERVIRA